MVFGQKAVQSGSVCSTDKAETKCIAHIKKKKGGGETWTDKEVLIIFQSLYYPKSQSWALTFGEEVACVRIECLVLQNCF